MNTTTTQTNRRWLVILSLAAAFGLAACGGDEATATEGVEVSDTVEGTEADGQADGSELPNACPAEGCQIFITDATTDPSGELQLTFDANFTPDFERNHIHVFWDSQEPGAVTSDFQAKGYDIQGKWHPTDDYPVYITQKDSSTTSDFRNGSVKVCVTAADTDHAVIDEGIFACRDVADILS